MTLSRKPVQIVEIDIDYCTHVYGTGACTAALASGFPRKCFNTFSTCQDTDNFDKGVLTLRFGMGRPGLPAGVLIYPALKSVSTSPTEINLGGTDSRTGALGRRERVKVSLLDFTNNDTGVDKYAAERLSGAAQFNGAVYNPANRGTFFGKLLARYPFWVGRALRVRNGYTNQTLAQMRTKHYVIAEPPSLDMAGRVSIVAKDVLDLADNDKALCPKPSQGKLDRDIDGSELATFDLVPATVGAEYAASGHASLGSEIVTFTRDGDTITLTARGLDGSDVSEHSVDDLFQQAYRVNRVPIEDVAAELLRDFAGIDPGFLPLTQWAGEAVWLAGYNLTTTIAKPTGITTLMGELSQLGVLWWWDEVAQLIKMRANRPLDYGEIAPELSDELHVLEGSLAKKALHDQRLTQVIFWHGLIDPSKSVTDGTNYRRAFVGVSDGGSANKYDQDQLHEVFCRWLGAGDDGIAAAVAERLIARFEDTPDAITFEIDAKDRTLLRVGDLARLTSRATQDTTGLSRQADVQVTSVEEHKPGHALRVTVQSHDFTGRFGFLMDDPQDDYNLSTDEAQEFGCFMIDENLTGLGDGTGPYLMF